MTNHSNQSPAKEQNAQKPDARFSYGTVSAAVFSKTIKLDGKETFDSYSVDLCIATIIFPGWRQLEFPVWVAGFAGAAR